MNAEGSIENFGRIAVYAAMRPFFAAAEKGRSFCEKHPIIIILSRIKKAKNRGRNLQGYVLQC